MPNNKKILIIEDDKDLAKIYAESFQIDGFETKSAYDGKEGLKVALEFHPDLILLDIMLPLMSGLEVLKALKSDPLTGKIPVILLTNVSDESVIIQGFQEAADGYIIKATSSPSQIKEEVKTFLSAK
jgi:DNA-binding response OmpR family regulator